MAVIVIFSVVFSVSVAAAPLDEAMEALINNKFEVALAALPSEASAANVPLSRGIILMAQGNNPEAALELLKSLEDPELLSDAEWEGILKYIDQISARVNLDSLLFARYGEFLAGKIKLNNPRRQSLLERMLKLSNRLGQWEKAKTIAMQLGYITQWSWVAGPFERFRAEDLSEHFGPEQNLSATEWNINDWAVRRVPVKKPLPLGTLVVDNHIYPMTGVAYAFTQFEIDGGGKAILQIETENSVRLWLNGNLLIHKDVANLDLARKSYLPCSVHHGSNWILVKSQKTSPAMALKVKLTKKDGTPFELFYTKGGQISSPRRIDPGSTPGLRHDIPPGVTQDLLSSMSASTLHPLLKRLLHWPAAAEYNAWTIAEDIANELIQDYADFAFAHRLLGQTYILQGEHRPGSWARLEKQAQKEFETVLKTISTDALSASLAAAYYSKRRTWDQSKAVVEKCIKERQKADLPPDVGLLLELGKVNREKQFWSEARQNFSEAFSLLPTRARTIKPLVGILNKSNAETEAFNILEKAYTNTKSSAVIRLFAEQARRTGRDIESVAMLEEYLSVYPNSYGMIIDRARIESRAGNWSGAASWFNRAIKLKPQDTLPLEELVANDLIQIQNDTSEKQMINHLEQAIKRLKDLLKLQPHSYRNRELLRQLKSQRNSLEKRNVTEDWYTQYDLQVENLDMAELEQLPQGRAGAVYLIDSAVMEIFPNGTARNQTHQAILLKNKEGRRRFAEVTIPIRLGVKLLWARTWSPDLSKTYEPTSIKDMGGSQALSMYNLEDGSIIDYAYEETLIGRAAPGNIFQDQLFYFGSDDDPMLVSRFTVIMSGNMNLQYVTNPDDFGPEVKQEYGKTVYIWEKRSSEGIKKEQFQPD